MTIFHWSKPVLILKTKQMLIFRINNFQHILQDIGDMLVIEFKSKKIFQMPMSEVKKIIVYKYNSKIRILSIWKLGLYICLFLSYYMLNLTFLHLNLILFIRHLSVSFKRKYKQNKIRNCSSVFR